MGIRLKGQTSGYVEIKAPATAADNTLTFPNGNGSNGQILTTDGSGNLSFSNPADTDKITEGNTEAEVVDSGSDGHFKVTTEGSERVRVGPAGQIGIGGANYGSTGQVLTSTGGSTAASWSNVEISSDTSPQLGGHLDVNGNDIVTTSNGDIDLDPNGSGQVVFKGNATRGSGAVKLNCENNSHGIVVQGPPHSAGANYTLTLPNDTGTSGQLLSTNGSGVTSWTDAAGGATFEATQAGSAIANGDTCNVRSDGKVEKVSQTTTLRGTSNYVSTARYDLNGVPSDDYRGVFDESKGAHLVMFRRTSDSNMFVQAFRCDSSTTRSEGTVESIFGGTMSEQLELVYVPHARGVLCFGIDTGGGLSCRFAEINSDLSITLHNSVTIESSGVGAQTFNCSYDKNAEKVVVVYEKSGILARVITIPDDPDNISAGTALTAFSGSYPENASIVYDDNAQKHVVICKNASNDLEGKVLTVSGTTATVGSGTTITTSQPRYTKGAYDPVNQKILFVFFDNDDGDDGKGFVATISGTSVSFGTVVDFESSGIVVTDCAYDKYSGRTMVCWVQKSTNDIYISRATISGTSVSFATAVDTGLNTNSNQHIGLSFDPIHNIAVITSKSSSGVGQQSFVQHSNVATNLGDAYIGISDGAYSSGATATIQIVSSIDDAQSGLIPGNKYYVQKDGTLALYANSPSVFAGTAVSATKLIVKG